MKRSLNIALLGRGFQWGGGTELLRNFANSLLAVENQQSIRLFLLLPVINKVDNIKDALGVICQGAMSIVREKKMIIPRQESVVHGSFLDFFKNIDGKLEVINYNSLTGLIPVLRRIGADVVIPAYDSLGIGFPVPWVGYIYDFQHKYLPENFSVWECLDRDIYFATMLRDAKAVVVNARAVKDDIDRFFPYRECEVFTLPFSAAPISSWLEDSRTDILEQYKLPPRYFLISNQFWIHKSHITAFRALAMLVRSESYKDIHLVCTGEMEDYRFPKYISELRRNVLEMGIEDKVHFLGHIPKFDQISIMKKCLAVLQPTLFEGGPCGGAVYDAIALGVPAIASDIPVNKEIEDEENLFFFKAGSATDLAEKIAIFLKKDIRHLTNKELLSRGLLRKQLMGERLLDAIHFVMD